MTDETIKEGFENLKDSKEYDLLYAAEMQELLVIGVRV